MADAYISGMTAAAALTGDEILEVSQLSATVDIAATTISALASDNSYNDSGSGFVAAGFAVGNRVNVAGFTGNVANNIFVGIVTALTAGKMTIGGADGNVIVDDAAGEIVSIIKWETHRSTAQDIAGLSGANVRPVSFPIIATPTTSEVLLMWTPPDGETVTFADEFAGSVGITIGNPGATYTMPVKLDGASVGSIAVSAGGVFTFVTTGATVVVVGGVNYLTVEGSATPDAGFENATVTLKGSF